MSWIRGERWARPAIAVLGIVLLASSIAYAAPVAPPKGPTIVDHLLSRWAPETVGGDECAVASPRLIGSLVDEHVRVTERELEPVGDGWRAHCGYGSGRLGLATATVTVTTAVDPADWEPNRRSSGPEPIPLPDTVTAGDEGYLTLGAGPSGTTEVRLQSRKDDTAVRLEYFAPVTDSHRMPNPLPGIRTVGSALHTARRTIAPGDDSAAATAPRKSFGECHTLDRSQAEEALEGSLTTTRSIRERDSAAADVHCSYAGPEASLTVTVWNRMAARSYIASLEPDLDDIGDEAAFDATVLPNGTSRMQASIRVGGSVVSIRGVYANDTRPDRRQPTEEERALLTSVVQALA